MPKNQRPRERRDPARRHHYRRARAVSAVVLAIGLLVTAVAFQARKSTVDNGARTTFDHQSEQITAAVSAGLPPNVEILDKLAKLSSDKGDLSIDDFRAFEQSLSLPTRYAGTYVIVLIQPVTESQRQAIVANAKAAGILAQDPLQLRPTYDLVVHSAPEAVRGNATGIDVLDLPAMGNMLDRARDTGDVLMSESIPQSTLEGVPPTANDPRMFSLVKPIYSTRVTPNTVEARRASLRGWASIVVYGDVFLNDARGPGKNRLGVELFAASTPKKSALLAAQPPTNLTPPKRGQLSRTVTIEHYGQPWTLRYKALVSFSDPGARREAYLFLVTGILISFLLSALTFVLLRFRARLLDKVDEATSELREAEERFRGAFEFAPIGMALIAPEGELLRVNRALCVLLGRDEQELLGLSIDDVTHPDFHEADRADRQRLLDGKIESYQTEKCYLHANGTVVWGALSLSRIAAPDGTSLYLVGKLEDVTDRKATEARLEHLATHDPLTSLPNRILFLDRLEHALARGERGNYTLAVLFLDLDGFKGINDTFGHAAGDHVLRELAARFTKVLRPADTVSRFGGDEFTLLCEELNGPDAAANVAERLADATAEPIDLGGLDVRVTASIGIALEEPAASSEELLRRADTALYLAKERGRDRVERFDAASPECRELLERH